VGKKTNKGETKMRKVIMIFEVEDLKAETELKAKVMQTAQIMKAKLRKIRSEKVKDKECGLQYL